MWRWDQAEPFGNNPADENPSGLGTFDLPLRLPGQRYDAETNLHYNYYRDFDPSLGIYKQSDPIGLVGGLNTYAYVGNNPLLKTDAEGLQASGGVSPQQNYFYQKCLDEELKYCTIGTGVFCGVLCGAAATSGGGLPAAIVVAGLCFPSVNYLCVERKKKYCADKWIR